MLRFLIFFFTLSACSLYSVSQDVQSNLDLTIHPTSLVQVPQGEKYDLWLSLTYNGTEPTDQNAVYVIKSVLSDERVAQFDNGTIEISAVDILNGNSNKSMILITHVLGELFINFTVHEKKNSVVDETAYFIVPNYNVTIISKSQTTDQIFTWVLTVGIIINTINMGCGLDMDIIKEVLKKPIGPVVGFVSQFIFMPLFGFGISWVIFDKDLLRLGLFIIGICPGGVASNFWTLLFNGDVNLSITMTFISTIAAIGMMPFWIWMLSGYYLNDYGHVKVPFTNLIISLITLTLPLGIGLLIRKYKRNWADFITEKVVKPVSLTLMVAMTALGMYNLSHIFILFNWSIVLSGVVLGWAGYFFGAVFAWVTRLQRPQIIAISFETALQNGAVGYVILKLSLQQPYCDIAAMPAISAMIFTSFTLFFVYAIYMCYTKISTYKKNKEQHQYKRSRSDLPTPMLEAPLLNPETPLSPMPPFHGGEVTREFAWAERAIQSSGSQTAPSSPVFYPATIPISRRPLQRQNSDAGTQTYYELK